MKPIGSRICLTPIYVSVLVYYIYIIETCYSNYMWKEFQFQSAVFLLIGFDPAWHKRDATRCEDDVLCGNYLACGDWYGIHPYY